MKFTHIVILFISIVLYAVIDLLWIGYCMKDWYINWLVHLIRPSVQFGVQHGAAVIITWSLIIAGIYHFVIPIIKNQSMLDAFLHGAYFGLVIYGVYETTNYAILYSWQPWMVLVDSLWGACICGLVTVLMQFLLLQV